MDESIMATNKNVQIGFRVTEAFQERIRQGCISRDLSIQDLITAAVEFYLKTPPNFDYMAATFVTDDSEKSRKQAAERTGWTTLWQKYIHEMPRAKTVQLAEVMKLDLLHYRSSRRKT